MKKLLILTTMLFPMAAFAFGDNINTSSNTNNSSAVNNTNNNNTSSSASSHNNNVNRNSNHQSQGQLQGQNQSQASSANGTNSNDISYTNNTPRSPVASAWAAPLTAGGESCMGSTSAAGQGVGFGLSLGSTWHDESCERRHDAITIYNMGEKRAAMALLCQEENVHKAMLAVGRYCPVDNSEDVKKFSSNNEPTTAVKVTDSYPQQPRR